MPVITIVTNVVVPLDVKKAVVQQLTAIFAEEIKTPPGHVHVHISDGQSFAFGGDMDTPAVFITVKASALQIWPDVRKVLIGRMVPVLQTAVNVVPERTTTMFEELPVENIAVGTNIAVFTKTPPISPNSLAVLTQNL
mmetsp:Transcript_28628/g.63006  ORF Transcript_28628/g.63006 Transcript_28628/m.63006 type:complete len:138 (-) Transcript_28628:519-932(-)|eukprot:CAMPEP_0202891690 /NCGR_PEP_ID=MMETSP1392-20130828/1685_1 /ASSEMBLY_ACC=CAM_ASM_000868 /TAXON_ID=225041 /ORGANISM="Chlamydomonas chlamydogama, Strain SAG 11-48b" /LENGTH=137 /DNA_ID=CAMNT_0049575515 /DNA_START=205 /DNA_END=618 /DNA_ORIENTATION=+